MTIRRKKGKKKKEIHNARRNRTGQKKNDIQLPVIASERTFYTLERKNL